MALPCETKAPFLRQVLHLRHSIPSHDTLSQVFRLLDPAPLEACFTRFMQRFAEGLQHVVATDGKTLRRSFDRAAGKSPLHLLHAWSADQRLVLDLLSLKGRIVIAGPSIACAPLPPKSWPLRAIKDAHTTTCDVSLTTQSYKQGRGQPKRANTS